MIFIKQSFFKKMKVRKEQRTFVWCYREETSRANCKRKYILKKLKICIYSEDEICEF
jgi:hypothetical protein